MTALSTGASFLVSPNARELADATRPSIDATPVCRAATHRTGEAAAHGIGTADHRSGGASRIHDQSHFTTTFRKVTSMTPRSYRFAMLS